MADLYISPDHDIDTNLLCSIFIPKTIIVGDLNSKNTLRGSPDTDQWGVIIENLIDNDNFVVLNNGLPTYTHCNGTRSHLDLSIVCHTLGAKSDLEVLNDTLGSDHSPTITHINVHQSVELDNSQKFILWKADWEPFKINSRKLLSADSISETKWVNDNSEISTSAITKSAELSIHKVDVGDSV